MLTTFRNRSSWTNHFSLAYLTLRGLDYAQCVQPPTLPRPDIASLCVQYRRIPILTIGRDVYCDSRLILSKLEQLLPDGALGIPAADQQGVQKLLQIWIVEAGIFVRASQLIPPETPLLNDPKFQKDREGFSGRRWSMDAIKAMRPEALAHIRTGFRLLETTFLADGRNWILKSEGPSLADVEGEFNDNADTKDYAYAMQSDLGL